MQNITAQTIVALCLACSAGCGDEGTESDGGAVRDSGPDMGEAPDDLGQADQGLADAQTPDDARPAPDLGERCSSVGSRECVGDTAVLACERFFIPAQYECGALGCTAGACTGDVCANAIEVPFADLPVTIDLPTLEGYSSQFEFDACQSLEFEGPELVFRVTGISTGDVLSIDASEDVGNERDSAIFVTETCAETSCLAEEDLLDALSWTSTIDGEVFVTVDRLRRTPDTVDGHFVVELESL